MITWAAMIKRPVVLTLCGVLGLAAVSMSASQDTDALSVRVVAVNGSPLPWQPGKELSLGASPKNIVISFGRPSDANQRVTRYQTKLEGFESEWQNGGGEMFVTIRFLNASGEPVAQKDFTVHRNSAGWCGSLESSTFTHRRETLTAPADAARLLFIMTSAGGPTTMGIYVVDDLSVSRFSGSNGPPEVLLRDPFHEGTAEDEPPNQAPAGWVRDGTHPSMAKVVEIGQAPKRERWRWWTTIQ